MPAGHASSLAAAPTQPAARPAPARPSVTFYKRELPCPPAIAFSSAEGKALFAEALAAGTMAGFFPLVEQFRTQDEPAFCGLASLAMVLNTLSIDPRRAWKGPWRWFHEQMLDCCLPVSQIAEEGIHLDQAACLARCNGARVDVVRQPDISLADFRGEVARAAASEKEHIIVSYSRKAFRQTGDGHFSPIGGYNAARDHVLILDTARFKYPPHWVPLPLLWEAMGYLDAVTGRPRGFLRMGARLRPSSVLFTLDPRASNWQEAAQFVERIPGLCAGAGSSEAAVAALAAATPAAALASFLRPRAADAGQCCDEVQGSCVQPAAVQQMLAELHSTEIFQAVARLPAGAVAPGGRYWREQLCLAALLAAAAQPQAGQQEGIRALLAISERHQILKAEVDFLASQFSEMPALEEAHRLQRQACCGGGNCASASQQQQQQQ